MITYTLDEAALAEAHTPQLERIITDYILVIETPEDYDSLTAAQQAIIEWRTQL